MSTDVPQVKGAIGPVRAGLNVTEVYGVLIPYTEAGWASHA